jgi:hypothetical protein
MDKKLLVTIAKPSDLEAVKKSGAKLLAEYDTAALISSTEAQEQDLNKSGLEVAPLAAPAIQLAGGNFEFSAALAADDASPVVHGDPERKAYYLVQLIGPGKREWFDEITALGAVIHNNAKGFTLIVGIEPNRVNDLRAKPFVEAITPYRSTMKVSPRLRGLRTRALGMNELTALESVVPDVAHQVEVSVFPGESTSAVTAAVKAAGGSVIAETPDTVTAMVPATAIASIAERPGVQSILPHSFPKLFNDRALPIMEVPADGVLGEIGALRGAGEIVAIADSGLDSGNANTVHPDFAGRVAGLFSFPMPANFLPFTKNQPGLDDGPSDKGEGHGTHVAGSVLGSGAAARSAGSNFVPQGTAPEAHVFFQAVEQEVNWKSRNEMLADGQNPGSDWPPEKLGLYGLPNELGQLFLPAYMGGARIHTNSWGSADALSAQQYNANASATDRFMFEHRDMLILFSAGNSGVDRDADGVIDLGSVSPPGTAKNCLTVGACQNHRPSTDTLQPNSPWNGRWDAIQVWKKMANAGFVAGDAGAMACFSSRGPTAEGRIKPDVVAPGTSVLSTRSSMVNGDTLWGRLPTGHPLRDRYCWSGGTSMATPLVAGFAALVRQYLVKERGHHAPGSKPSGALVKAFIINGAIAMGEFANSPAPTRADSVAGFGRINLRGSIAPDGREALFDDEPQRAVATGEMRVFAARIADISQPLRVTLAWTDAPSLPNNGSLENELYLQLQAPDGTILNGDITPFPNATNNVQRIIVANPAAGTYQIRVRGINVVRSAPGTPPGAPRQDFALVASNVETLDPSQP